jgi:S1-C subfamily serine protease
MVWWNEAETALRDMAEGAGPSVVGVGHRWGVGSGVVVGRDEVLTNAHNLRADEVRVTFSDGRVETGRARGVDVDGDVAVIAVGTGKAPAIAWSEVAAEVGMGTPIFALANPGGRGLRATFGFVSGTERSFRGPRGRRIAGSIEHTAPLLPGSSGGPVLDATGGLVGINTNRLGEGFYLAIPADADLRARVEALARGESPARPRLGIGVAPAEVAHRLRRAVGLPEVDGLLVRQVEDDGPAAAAGLSEGDLIVAADGRPVGDPDTLHEVLEQAGANVELTLVRGSEERTMSVQLAPPAA